MIDPKITTISIANDFSRFPAGRFRDDGEASGSAFREDMLAPALRDKTFDKVVVDFDGVAGFGSSFLEEAFGGLVRTERLGWDDLNSRLELVTTERDLNDYIELSRRYIEDAVKHDQ